MEFDINNYPGEVVMHCPEEWMAEAFCNYMHSIGKKWISGLHYNKITHYEDNRSKTCYFFNENVYSDMAFYQKAGYTILEFEDFADSFPFGDKDNPIAISKVATQKINAFFAEFAVVGGVTNA